jgi:hypothetical protein
MNPWGNSSRTSDMLPTGFKGSKATQPFIQVGWYDSFIRQRICQIKILRESIGSVSIAKGWEKRVKAGEKRKLKSLQMVE